MVEKFRKRPLEISAIHCTFSNRSEWWNELIDMCKEVGLMVNFHESFGDAYDDDKIIFTTGATYNGRPLVVLAPIHDGDYLVKGIDDSIYPVQKETFEKIYEKVDAETDNVISW